MAPDIRSPRLPHLVVFLFFALIAIMAVPDINAQQPDIIVRVGDTTATAGQENTVISVYLTNYADTVVGYNI